MRDTFKALSTVDAIVLFIFYYSSFVGKEEKNINI